MDGQAEPGEIVWVTVPSDPPQERSLVVIGREHHDVLGLLISPREKHRHEDHWLGIGSGEWDDTGDPCWVRLDKTLMVPETEVHRRGTYIPPAALRAHRQPPARPLRLGLSASGLEARGQPGTQKERS